MKSSIPLLFSLHLINGLYSQQTVYVCQAINKEPIPFATALLEENKHAYLSDENGLLLLPPSAFQKIIVVQHLSFEFLSFVLIANTDTVFLKPKIYTIPEILIHDISPLEVLKKVVSNMDKNYPQSSFYLEGVYRQTHKENEVYARFIEAKITVLNEGMNKELNQNQEESFATRHLRKSYNYEKNGDQHGDHLVDLFAENPVQYLQKSIFNLNNFTQYDWALSFEGFDLLKIEFRNKPWTSLKNLSGYVLINKSNYAMEYVRIYELPNDANLEKNISNWRLINGWYEASFKHIDGFYVLDKSTKWYNHEIRNELNMDEVDYLVEEQFEWSTENVLWTASPSLKFNKLSNLYSLELPYAAKDWTHYPLPITLRTDLEKVKSLELQFNNP